MGWNGLTSLGMYRKGPQKLPADQTNFQIKVTNNFFQKKIINKANAYTLASGTNWHFVCWCRRKPCSSILPSHQKHSSHHANSGVWSHWPPGSQQSSPQTQHRLRSLSKVRHTLSSHCTFSISSCLALFREISLWAKEVKTSTTAYNKMKVKNMRWMTSPEILKHIF